MTTDSERDDGLFKKEGYELVGAAFEVYREIGTGFLEEVYQECLERELTLRSVPFESQPSLPVFYKGIRIGKHYRPDLYVCGGIVAELKAMKALTDNETAQLLNYLKATGKRVGYLLNFGCPQHLEWKRMVL